MSFRDLMGTVDRSVRVILGEPITYSPGSGSPVTVQGVFDASYERVDVGHAGVASSTPACFLSLSDLPSDPSDDVTATVTFAGVVYQITEAQPDGLGAVRLLLHVTP